MNKKVKIVAASIAAGVLMLSMTAFASVNSVSGYDTYKSAVKNISNIKNVTADVKISVKDNGSDVANVSSLMKMDRDSKTMSQITNITSADGQKTMSSYEQGGKRITKNSDSEVYNVFTTGSMRNRVTKKLETSGANDTKVNNAEKLADALVGNYQNYFTLKAGQDGTKDVEFKISDDQVPALVNAVVSIVSGNKMQRSMNSDSPKMAFEDKVPKLTDNVKVGSIDVTGKIDSNNNIINQTANITVMGNDANGVSHVLNIMVNADLTNYNKTTPDSVDLTGKQVKNVEPKTNESFKQGK